MTDHSAAGGSGRIVGIDVARGYAMLLLVAIEPLWYGFRGFSDLPVLRTVFRQLTHPEWHGFRYVDFGFPGFLIIVGLVIPLSLDRRLERGQGRAELRWHMARRALVLFLLGIFYNGGLTEPWPDVRIAGVLQRIAICYLAAGLLYLHASTRARVAVTAGILLGYWGLLEWVPVPGYGAGNLTFQGNLAAYVDRLLLPGATYFGEAGWDPEGIVSNLPAIATCLVGVLTTELVLRPRAEPGAQVRDLAMGGMAAIAAGYLWGFWFPLNKPLWTSSFVLVCSGLAWLHLAAFVLVADVWKSGLVFPLVVVGANPLVAYIGAELLPLREIALRLVGGDVQALLGAAGPPVVAVTEVLVLWLLLFALYRRRMYVTA